MPRHPNRFLNTDVPAVANLAPAPDLAALALDAATELEQISSRRERRFRQLPVLVMFLDERVAGPAHSFDAMRHADHSTLYLVGNAIERGTTSDSSHLRRSLQKADRLTREMKALVDGKKPTTVSVSQLRDFCLELAQVVMDERNQPFAAFDHGFHHR